MVTHVYDPGRPGPPLFLGILILLAGPVLGLVMMGRTAVSHLDIQHTGPVPNHHATSLVGNATYVIATPASQQGSGACTVRVRNGDPVTVTSATTQAQTLNWGGEAYLTQGSFFLKAGGFYVVNCPKAGSQLMLVPLKGSLKSFGGDMLRGLVLGGLVVVIGLLMIVFHRKPPRDLRV